MKASLCTNVLEHKFRLQCQAVPLMDCQLIALDKRFGIHPVDIGKTVRCIIITKAILSVISDDIQYAAGSLQANFQEERLLFILCGKF